MSDCPTIVLASQSPRRAQLLRGLEIPFDVVPSNVAEIRAPGEHPRDFAVRAALEKGEEVLERLAEEGRTPWIVSADTIVVLGDRVFLKPRSRAEAREMMQALEGRTHHVITGWAIGRSGHVWHAEHTVTKVTFHPLSAAEIDRYVETGEGLDKAGAYAIQGIGAFLVDRIEGNYFNVVGLPVSHVARALVTLGALPAYPLS